MNDKTPEQKAEDYIIGDLLNTVPPDWQPSFRTAKMLDVHSIELKKAYLAGYKAAKEEERWIPVREGLPEESGKYLTIRFEGDLGSDLSWDADLKGWNVNSGRNTEIFPTHWRHMPEPPTKEADHD